MVVRECSLVTSFLLILSRRGCDSLDTFLTETWKSGSASIETSRFSVDDDDDDDEGLIDVCCSGSGSGSGVCAGVGISSTGISAPGEVSFAA